MMQTGAAGETDEKTGHEQRQADSLQQELLKLFSDLFDQAPFGYFTVDRSGKIIWFNEAACDLLGIRKLNLGGERFDSLLDPSDHARFAAALEETFLTHRKVILEFYPAHKRKSRYFRAEAIVKEGENICKIALVDISEKKRTEDALIKSEEKYRMLIDLAADAFFQGNKHGDFITVNDRAVEMTGYSRDELLTMNLKDLFDDSELSEKPLRYDLLHVGMTIKTDREMTCRDGRRLLVEMNSRAMPDGTYQSFFRDITERRIAEKAIIASERKYRNLHTSMMDGFVYADLTGRILETNRAYEDMIGFSAEELTKLTYLDLTPEKWHRFEQSIIRDQLMTGGHSVVYQKEYRKKDGTIFPVELRTFLIREENGDPKGMWAIVRDITERKQAEEELRRSVEQKEVLLREIHHRVKNNLAIVISLLNFQLRNNSDSNIERMIHDIQSRIRSMALIHENLYRSETLDRIPLASYLESLSRMILTTFSGHRITLDIRLAAVDVNIESALPIGLIVNELLTNAFKYAFPDGAEGKVLIHLEQGEDCMIRLVVEDNGVGLPELSGLDSEKSLGLYIVGLLVDQLEGNIEIVRNRGTSFRISFLNRICLPHDKKAKQ